MVISANLIMACRCRGASMEQHKDRACQAIFASNAEEFQYSVVGSRKIKCLKLQRANALAYPFSGRSCQRFLLHQDQRGDKPLKHSPSSLCLKSRPSGSRAHSLQLSQCPSYPNMPEQEIATHDASQPPEDSMEGL